MATRIWDRNPGSVVLTFSEDWLGCTIALWRLDDDLQVLQPQVPKFDAVRYSEEFGAIPCVIFTNVPPGTYMLRLHDIECKLATVTIGKPGTLEEYRWLNYTTREVPGWVREAAKAKKILL